jgi:hypothetical protein
MIRRPLTALAAAAAAELCCVAGSFFHAMRLVAHVEDVSVWSVLGSRLNTVLCAWRSSLTVGDLLLFVAVAVVAAAGVLAGPVLRPAIDRYGALSKIKPDSRSMPNSRSRPD